MSLNRPWINYHHLYYFKTIAQEGGVGKAAKKLRLGQPTLSTQMKQFEESLGQRLFDRSGRRMALTEAGRRVLGYAVEIFRLGDDMLHALSDSGSGAKVQVLIGAMDTVPKHLTSQLFHRARAWGPCVVAIVEGHGDELLRELRAHRLDLVLSNYPPPVGESGGFFAKCVARMPVVVCGSMKYVALRRGFPGSLRGQPFVMPLLGSRLRDDVEHFLALHRIDVDTVAEVQDTSLQKILGAHGDGLIPIALPAVEEYVRSKELVQLGILPDVHEELWLISAHRKVENPVAAVVMREFKV